MLCFVVWIGHPIFPLALLKFNAYQTRMTNEALKIGQTYPIEGMITDVTLSKLGAIEIEINKHILARLWNSDKNDVEFLKAKAFEPGVFLSTVTAIEPRLELDCQAVFFNEGKTYSA